MPRGKTKKPKIVRFFDKYKSHLYKFVLALFLVLLALRHKALIIIILFEILDWTKNVVKHTLPYFPLEIRFVFGVTASYYYSPYIGIIIFCLGIINRTMLHLEIMHIVKAIRHIPLFFFVQFLQTRSDFFIVAMIALTLNYVMKYVFRIAKDPETMFDSAIYLFTNYFIGALLFYLISVIYFYFPFLA